MAISRLRILAGKCGGGGEGAIGGDKGAASTEINDGEASFAHSLRFISAQN